jgi:hypothetical protein
VGFDLKIPAILDDCTYQTRVYINKPESSAAIAVSRAFCKLNKLDVYQIESGGLNYFIIWSQLARLADSADIQSFDRVIGALCLSYSSIRFYYEQVKKLLTCIFFFVLFPLCCLTVTN